MSHPPNDPKTRHVTQWRIRVDEEISFDEVRRAVFGQRLREDHSTVLADPLTDRMTELLQVLHDCEADVSGRAEKRLDQQ